MESSILPPPSHDPPNFLRTHSSLRLADRRLSGCSSPGSLKNPSQFEVLRISLTLLNSDKVTPGVSISLTSPHFHLNSPSPCPPLRGFYLLLAYYTLQHAVGHEDERLNGRDFFPTGGRARITLSPLSTCPSPNISSPFFLGFLRTNLAILHRY